MNPYREEFTSLGRWSLYQHARHFPRGLGSQHHHRYLHLGITNEVCVEATDQSLAETVLDCHLPAGQLRRFHQHLPFHRLSPIPPR